MGRLFCNKANKLGDVIDSTFTYKQHVCNCLQKAYGTLHMLYPHKAHLAVGVKFGLCESLVLSFVNYCSQVWIVAPQAKLSCCTTFVCFIWS